MYFKRVYSDISHIFIFKVFQCSFHKILRDNNMCYHQGSTPTNLSRTHIFKSYQPDTDR